MKIPKLQDALNIFFNTYWDGPIDIENNKEEAQAFITRLIEVGIDANEDAEMEYCKSEFIKLWNKKDKKIAEEQFNWFWLNYGPKFITF